MTSRGWLGVVPLWSLIPDFSIRRSNDEVRMGNRAKDTFDAKAFLARLGERNTVLSLSKGENVFLQGDTADAVFYLQKGRLKLSVQSEQGKEAGVGTIEPGQFF